MISIIQRATYKHKFKYCPQVYNLKVNDIACPCMGLSFRCDCEKTQIPRLKGKFMLGTGLGSAVLFMLSRK